MQNIIGNLTFHSDFSLEPNLAETYDFEEEIISSNRKICKIQPEFHVS